MFLLVKLPEQAGPKYTAVIGIVSGKYFGLAENRPIFTIRHSRSYFQTSSLVNPVYRADHSLCGCGAKPAAYIVTRKTPTEVEGGRIYN